MVDDNKKLMFIFEYLTNLATKHDMSEHKYFKEYALEGFEIVSKQVLGEDATKVMVERKRDRFI